METTMTPEAFETALTEFVRLTQAAVDANVARLCPETSETLNRCTIVADRGKRYVRIVDVRGGSRSARCFVDTTNGDILKSAGWKAPAKGARGNIFRLNVAQLGSRYYR